MTIDEAIKTYTSNAEHERTHGCLQGCLNFRQLVEWLKELKQLRKQTKWIPANKKLPKEENTYEVTLQGIGELEGEIDNEVAYATWLGRDKNDWIYHDVEDWKDKKVIAWKPLTKPYKAKK